MGLRFCRLFALLSLASSAVCAPLAATPKALWDAVRAASLDPARAVKAEGLDIDMEGAVLHLDRGVLVPARPIDGRTTELVFLGQGRFDVHPADRLERQQLELFTRRSELDVAIDQAVVVLGRSAIAERLLGREPIGQLDDALAAEAQGAFRAWVDGAERRGFGADTGAWRALLGDPVHQQFFVAWCRSAEVGEFYYRLDPTEIEQVTLGQFKPVETGDLEEARMRKEIQRGRREGRYGQLRFEDLGDWDTWISTALSGADGKAVRGTKGFESESYALDVQVDPSAESLEGSARIAVRCEAGDRRVVPLTLTSDLRVQNVEDGAGQPLAWVRSGADLQVAFDRPFSAGERLTLVVHFGGKALFEIQKGIYVLSSTVAWYPHVGDVDRATYEAKLSWPKGKELLASGRLVESGVDGGRRWERRKLELPAIAFSFEVGDYDVRQAQAGHVDLTIGFCKAAGENDAGAAEEIVATIQEVLPFLEQRFGPYPLDYMTVVTVPREVSQGLLGFVSLSHYLMWRPNTRGYRWTLVFDPDDPRFDRKIIRRETVAHELSHQWWGNQVGWSSYRDQWLSEALADYSATLFAAHKAQRKSVYLALHAKSWKSTLNASSQYGRTVESLGPVVMGSRLNSSQSSSAYQAVVYDKGALVFHMLARVLGPEPFAEMLKNLVAAVHNRPIDTATFVGAMEKMSGFDLRDFAERFIYGTGIPEVYYTYRFAPQEGGKWSIEGEARQVPPGGERYTLHRTEAGAWDVSRVYHAALDISRSTLVVPFQISLAEAKDETTKVTSYTRQKTTTQTGLGGNLVLQGEVTPIRIPLDRRPEGFWLDQRGEVLASFYCEQREPKRMLRYRAIEVARAGRYDEAEQLYGKALEAPLLTPGATDDPPPKKEEERLARSQDAAIHIGLATLHLERNDDAAASAALDAADRLLTGLDKDDYGFWRKTLRARIVERSGDYDRAYDILGKVLYLDFQQRHDESLADAARRARFQSGDRYYGGGDDYALFAAAAWETGHEEVARAAVKEAKKRDADVTSLETLMPK